MIGKMATARGSLADRRRVAFSSFAGGAARTVLLAGGLAAPPSFALAQTTLPTIVIDGESAGGTGGEGAAGPDKTIVAERTTVGSKTDTPVLDLPAAVSIITEVEMEKRGVADIQQALGYTSSVAVDAYGSDDRYDYFRIRGFDQTIGGFGLYRDGLSLRFPGWTGTRMEPYGLQRLEVLKGSTSTLFGLNGPGGLINGVTKRPQDAEHGEVYTTIGEDHIEGGTDFGGRINDDWSYRITAKTQDGTHGRDFSDNDRTYLAPALTWRPTDATTLTILTDYQKRESNSTYGVPYGVAVDPNTFLGEPDFNKFDVEEKNIGYLFEHRFGNGLTVRQNARYTDLTLDYEQVYIISNGATDPRTAFAVDGESERFAIDTQLQYDVRWDGVSSKTLFGVDYLHYNMREYVPIGFAPPVLDFNNPVYSGRDGVTLTGVYLNWKPQQDALGTYLQEEVTFDDRWILTLGGRYDHVDSATEDLQTGTVDEATDKAFTKRAGLTYKATGNLSLYANYSESFQPVTGGYEPQEGTQYEVGAKYKPSGLNALFTVALFDLTQTNVPVPVIVGEPQQQVGEVNVRGIEVEGKMALFDRLNLTLAYSYWDAEIVENGANGNEGNRPAAVPEHLASIWADYTIPGDATFGDLTLGLGARFIGATFGDDANTVEIDAHTVFDAAAIYKIADDWSLALNATNLFDKEYISTVYYGTAYYGDGRTVKATLKHTW
jgi:iron complex outermembrane receptor protein